MMRSSWRVSLLLFVLSTIGCSVTRQTPPDEMRLEEPALRREKQVSGFFGERGEELHRIENYPMLSRVPGLVLENYGDPSRIDPKRMIVASLEGVERAVDEVTVRWDEGSSQMTVTAGESTDVLDLSEARTLSDVGKYLEQALQTIEAGATIRDARAVEYAAANGMLSALDPLSTFIEPRILEEWRTQSQGELGALGFVMAMRDGKLTLVRVLAKGPAKRAGLEEGDILAEIGDHSTANVDLPEAVEWLRGKPGTEVAIAWSRGSEPLQRAVLTREVIALEPVAAKLLDGGVACAKLSQFSSSASRDLRTALDAMRARASGLLQGIILDLRGNYGGLLDQAVAVSDLFLSEGVIVRVEGEAKRRPISEVEHASAGPDDVTGVPMVVLVDGTSAAAAEIVAAALQQGGRALVIGSRTAGAGSIQALFPAGSTSDGALRLTIARFFMPSGTPIEDTGVPPDVALRAACIRAGEVRAFAPARAVYTGRGLANGVDLGDRRGSLAVHYLKADDLKADDAVSVAAKCDEPGSALGLAEDYPILFSRDLLLRSRTADRARLLAVARTFADERRGEEESRLAARLATLGVDWSSGPADGAPRAEVAVSTSPPGRARAGETVQWTVTVENRGSGDFRRLRAWSVADGNSVLDRREFVFGTVKAGQRRSQTVPVRIPESMASRRDVVVLRFEDENGHAPPEVRTAFEVIERARPQFAIRARVENARARSTSALDSEREQRILSLEVRNVGEGGSGAGTYAALKSLDGGIFIIRGRDLVGSVAPGATKKGALAFRVRDGLDDPNVRVRVAVSDEAFGESASRDLELAVAELRERPSGTARTKIDPPWQEPPRITLVPQPSEGVPIADGERFTLRGTALAAPGSANLRDVRIFANGRKVLYRKAPESAGAAAIDLSFEVSLVPGDNAITVEARGVDGLDSRRALHVYRRSPSEIASELASPPTL